MTNSFAPVAALIVKLPKGNPIRKAFDQANKRAADYAARGKLAWKSRRAPKRRKASR